MLGKLIIRIHNLMQLDNVTYNMLLQISYTGAIEYKFSHGKYYTSVLAVTPSHKEYVDIFCSEVNKYLNEIGG